MATEVIKSPNNACTLYELEDHLQALGNRIEMAEDESSRQLILEEIGQALRRTKEKRDLVAAFLWHCEMQRAFADAEVERVEKRKALIATVEEHLERYVVQLIEQLAPADRKGIQRLEGNVSSMRIQRNPDSGNSRTSARICGRASVKLCDLQGHNGIRPNYSGDQVPGLVRIHAVARLLFSANRLPPSCDASQAFFDLWLIIPLANRFRHTRREMNSRSATVCGEELSGARTRH
jgi:hypothetical protein